MNSSKRIRLVRRRRLVSYTGRGRGPIYSWLRLHHAKIKGLRIGDLRPWADLILDMEEDLAGTGDARALTVNNVWNIWQRVCRDVEADMPRATPVGGKYPSRIAPDWRPQTVSPPPPIRPSAPITPTPSNASAVRVEGGPKSESREGLEELDRAMEMLRAADRSKFRFGG
jgi:hypothetical protein